MTLRFIILLLLPWYSYGQSLTANVMTNMSQTKIVKSYSKYAEGIIQTPLCVSCPPSELLINSKTKLFVKGKPTALEELTLTSIKEKKESIQIQYYRSTMLINYIIWGESDIQKSEPK